VVGVKAVFTAPNNSLRNADIVSSADIFKPALGYHDYLTQKIHARSKCVRVSLFWLQKNPKYTAFKVWRKRAIRW
jgi:hypothetical protein